MMKSSPEVSFVTHITNYDPGADFSLYAAKLFAMYQVQFLSLEQYIEFSS
jgi:hypothetical protein